MTPYKARVTEDIISNSKGRVYAKRFDVVMIVAIHGEVLIAEKNKERFPVRKEKVQEL